MEIRRIETRIKWRGKRELTQSEKRSKIAWIWRFGLYRGHGSV